jgi:hypothetical protein
LESCFDFAVLAAETSLASVSLISTDFLWEKTF